MIWVLAFAAALLCAVLASESRAMFGFLSGFALVALVGTLHRQSRRIDALVEQLRRNETSRSPEPPPVPASVEPVAAPTPPPSASPAPALQASSSTAPQARTSPRPPREPDLAERFAARLRAFFLEGNVPVKLGLLVSLFGVGALVRYAASAGWLSVPVSMRYAGIALAALAMLVYGLRQARLRPAFGLSLQGGAIGILLLVVFGSHRVPGLLPPALAFALVLGLVAGAAVLAVRQNAVWLAAIGFLGGYLAPLLLSTGSGNHVALFTYYLLLNGAVFGMAWVKPWRALNLLGFVLTFGVGAIWGAQYFRPELFWTTEPFLVATFLLYVGVPVLYALRGGEPGKVDATLLFGTPLLAFPMQVALLEGERMPLAFSALGVGAVYLLLALWSRRETKLRVLGQSAAALGLAFATLAVPLALSARWTSATWALQGVALLWLGQAQHRRWLQAAGVALQWLAAAAYLGSYDGMPDATAVLNPHTLNLLLLVVGAGACAWLLDRQHGSQGSTAGAVMAVLASVWWFWAGAREVGTNLGGYGNPLDYGPAWVVFVALTCLVVAALRAGVDWRKPAWWPAIALPTAVLAVGLAFLEDRDWLSQPQGLALPALALSIALVLPRLRALTVRLATAHIAGIAALCLAVGLGIHAGLSALNIERLGEGWRWVLPWLPLAGMTVLLLRRPAWAGWPVGDRLPAYRPVALGLALLVLGTVWLLSQASGGGAGPLPWVPLLNPLELFHLAGVLGLLAWLRYAKPGSSTATLARLATGAAAFMVLSMVTLRASWHYGLAPAWHGEWSGGIDWAEVAAWPTSQAALSIAWATAGMLCWILGSRRGSRPLWTFGALLLGAVLLKLLLVDRSNLGDLLGIVSFLVVGGLLVAIGRIAPRPPGQTSESP